MNDLLSVVVVHFNIAREFPRTLYSLSPVFQRGISADEYEVIVVDNGSTKPPDLSEARALGLDITLLSVPNPSPSPARAINIGLNASVGRWAGVFIDGARLASPGLLARAREALMTSERAVVGTRGRYLGPAAQRRSVTEGYSREVEDQLLESIDWQRNGDRLFEISVFDESSGPDWFAPVSESNSLFMGRRLWAELGGYDEVFDEPGGGYLNLDTWRRVCELPGVRPTLLLGEATFHQLHGGVATNSTEQATTRMRERYEEIRQRKWAKPSVPLHFWGTMAGRPPLDELGLTAADRKQITEAELGRRTRAGAKRRAAARSRRRTQLRNRLKVLVPASIRRKLRAVRRRVGRFRRWLRRRLR